MCPLKFPAGSWVRRDGSFKWLRKGVGLGVELCARPLACHSLGPGFNHQHNIIGDKRERKRTMFRLAGFWKPFCVELSSPLCSGVGVEPAFPGVAVGSLRGYLGEVGIDWMKGSQLSADTPRKN